MQCPRCDHQDRQAGRFCSECGPSLALARPYRSVTPDLRLPSPSPESFPRQTPLKANARTLRAPKTLSSTLSLGGRRA